MDETPHTINTYIDVSKKKSFKMVQLSLINTSYRGNIIAVLFVLELHFRNCTADIAVERQKGSHEQSPEEAPGICP